MTNRTAREALDRAANPGRVLTEAAEAGQVSMTRVLHAVGLDPSNPNHQAALLVCEKYGLDPLLKHVVVFSGGTYITRDGWLAIAHRSGQLDGIEVSDEDATDSHYRARAAVHRKDMAHPFTYRGRYPIKGRGGKGTEYGPEMAVKVAEVAALRRAFPVDIPGVGAWEERWDMHETAEIDDVPAPPTTGEADTLPLEPEGAT